MADKTVAQKTRMKPGTRIAVLNEVPGIVASLGLPEDTTFVEPADAQVVFLFATTQGELDGHMPAAIASLKPDAVLWVFFRKGSKAAGLDMNRDSVWAAASALGMRPVGIVSVDTEWAAFRLRKA